MNKNSIYLGIGLLALIIVPIAIWGVVSFSQQGTEEVTLIIVPSDSTVKINDTEYKNKKTIRLEPGTYTISTTKEGFETDSQSVTVEKRSGATVFSLLAPVSDEAQQWARKNQTAYLEAEGKSSSLATKEGEELIKRFPVTKWLPLQKATYVIGYKKAENSNKDIVITITATAGYREAALQEIRDRGFDPSDYVIEFNDYRNPFNE